MKLPDYVNKAIKILEQNGFDAYVVGGCVRNFLLGEPVSDYDITTSALPEQIKAAFSAYPVIETGISHGTVTVLIHNNPLEITTFREDQGYSDHRRPDSVNFSKSLEGDLKRRDFTVNSLAFNERSGIVDLFGGKSDLEKSLLRCVGDADERFNEDALRILRALRFASVYGFCIEEKTAASIIKNYQLLSYVSKERILSELKKLICGKNAEGVLLDFSKVVYFILPQLKTNAADYKKAVRSLCRLQSDFSLRFAALFCFADEPNAKEALKSLKCDKKTETEVCLLLKFLNAPINTKSDIKLLLSVFEKEHFASLLALKRAVLNTDTALAQACAEEILQNNECYCLSQLAVSGADLLKLGFKGKEIGAILKLLLDAVISERLPNDFDALIEYAKEQA